MLKHLMSGSHLSSIAPFAAAADTGSKPEGVSKKDKALLKVLREAYETDTGHDCRLTDDGILAIVGRIGREAYMEMDADAQIELLKKGEEIFKDIAVSDPGISGLVAKLDEPFYKEMDACVEAIIKGKQSAIDMLGQFKRVWSKEQFDACPYPGSDADDVKGTNYKPDIVETKAVAGGKIRTVFLNDLVQAMPKGKAAQATMDEADKELKTTGASARFKSKGKQALRDIFNSAKQERDGIRKVVRTAIQLHHKLSAIDGMPLVKWQWMKGTDDKCPQVPTDYRGDKFVKVTRGPKPIWLEVVEKTMDGDKPVYTVDTTSGKEYSVAQIIAFNPDKALKMPEGGTVGNLIDSAKPEPETPESKGEKMSQEEMDTTVVVIHAKLSNTEERAAFRKRLLQPDNETLRDSVCALYLLLRPIYTANSAWYDARLSGTPEDQAKADAAEAAARKANAA